MMHHGLSGRNVAVIQISKAQNTCQHDDCVFRSPGHFLKYNDHRQSDQGIPHKDINVAHCHIQKDGRQEHTKDADQEQQPAKLGLGFRPFDSDQPQNSGSKGDAEQEEKENGVKGRIVFIKCKVKPGHVADRAPGGGKPFGQTKTCVLK